MYLPRKRSAISSERKYIAHIIMKTILIYSIIKDKYNKINAIIINNILFRVTLLNYSRLLTMNNEKIIARRV